MTKKSFFVLLLIPFLLAGCGQQDDQGNNQTVITPPTSDKQYIGNSPEECATIRFMCVQGFEPFTDERGCGCQKKQQAVEDEGNEKLALIDNVDTLVEESFPVQVTVAASGNLRNGCESIGKIEKSVDQRNIKIYVDTKDAVCTQALIPFAEQIRLDVTGWKKGTYLVDVNGVKASFTLSVDNILRDPAQFGWQQNEPGCEEDNKPVCGLIQVQCIKAPCNPVWETFPNRCSAEKREALQIKDGVCI